MSGEARRMRDLVKPGSAKIPENFSIFQTGRGMPARLVYKQRNKSLVIFAA